MRVKDRLRCKRRVAVGAAEMMRRAASRGQLQGWRSPSRQGEPVGSSYSTLLGCRGHSKAAAVTDGGALVHVRSRDKTGVSGRSMSGPSRVSILDPALPGSSNRMRRRVPDELRAVILGLKEARAVG